MEKTTDAKVFLNIKRCLPSPLYSGESLGIKAQQTKNDPQTAAATRNPYRAILRREYPEPLIALLAFLLGVWLWDHYFGKPAGYPPGTEEVALVKIDHDLRLADAMTGDPAWLRWLAGAENPQVARKHALAALKQLSEGGAMGLQGLVAYTVIHAAEENLPARQLMTDALRGQYPPDFVKMTQRLASGRGTWWQAKWVTEMEHEMAVAGGWRNPHEAAAGKLRTRAIVARSSVWLLGLAGLFFLPRTLVMLKNGLRAQPNGYAGAWRPSLGLVVFLVATLAWIGFTMTLEIGIETLPGLHPLAGILLDSAARLLPALIALGLLFRRPEHAGRVLGLHRGLLPGAVLGMFSLLTLLDLLLQQAIPSPQISPGGGLSAADAGWWGLAFAVVSACLLAPVAEETLYRGVLFRSLWTRMGVLPAALISSAVFAALHFYDGYGLASVAVFGTCCAMFYAATGSLTACIGLHMLYNSAIKLPEWFVYHAPPG